uniref:Uncharacterized protein n=1 Tax=Arundo donax TaxID=35708 RepID=A0A0A9D6A4_ARUDO
MAAANDDVKISSSVTSSPSALNFFEYCLLDFLELFVTKTNFLPIFRSSSIVSGTPSMSLSPFQITPSQSNRKASTESTRDRAASAVRRPQGGVGTPLAMAALSFPAAAADLFVLRWFWNWMRKCE